MCCVGGCRATLLRQACGAGELQSSCEACSRHTEIPTGPCGLLTHFKVSPSPMHVKHLPTGVIFSGPTDILLFPWRRCRETLLAMACWIVRFVFLPVGFVTLCQVRQLIDWRFCAWMGICTSPRWMLSVPSIRSCLSEAISSSTTTSVYLHASRPSTTTGPSTASPRPFSISTGPACSGNDSRNRAHDACPDRPTWLQPACVAAGQRHAGQNGALRRSQRL